MRGVASGVNNAVARVAGLLAIAIFGVVLARTFEARISARLDALALTPSVRTAVDRELPKMAGAELDLSSVGPGERSVIRGAIDDAFVAAFRLVMLSAAALAAAAALCGAGIPTPSAEHTLEDLGPGSWAE